jgi:hypothetical protein
MTSPCGHKQMITWSLISIAVIGAIVYHFRAAIAADVPTQDTWLIKNIEVVEIAFVIIVGTLIGVFGSQMYVGRKAEKTAHALEMQSKA